MRWRVLKMGRPLFDALHTYGVAITIATLTQQAISLQDKGSVYELTCSASTLPPVPEKLFDHLFPLPTEEQLALPYKEYSTLLPVTILDGLLAALLTVPGLSFAANVHDLCLAQRLKPLSIANGLQKVSQKIQTWQQWVIKRAHDATNWVAEMLDDYSWETPVVPVLAAGYSKRDLHILMTIDPSFAYSFRQAITTQDMTLKSNVTLHGTRYATLLAFIGASRFLRARSVASPSLIFTVPLLRSGMIGAQTSLPLLLPDYASSANLALTKHWLALLTTPELPEGQWYSLAYQTLQKQKRQQPLCCESGQLLFSWVHQVEQHAGGDVLAFWQRCLSFGSPNQQESLVELLKYQHIESWYRHVLQHSLIVLLSPESALRRYRFEEVRILTMIVDSSSSHPLRSVLDREKEGTVCFGRALHQLGRYNPARLRDCVELLEPIRTEEELLPVLRMLITECELAKLKGSYILIPSKDDFTLLMDDIHQHGIRQMIGVLLVLSAVHYQSSNDWSTYELSTLIRLLLWLIKVSPLQNQVSSPENESVLESFIAHEQFLHLPQEDSDETEH